MAKLIIKIDAELKDLIPKYLENRQKDLVQIDLALASGNAGVIAILSHRVAGSAGGYGFEELGLIAARMEAFAKNGDLSDIARQAQAMRSYLQEIEIVWQNE